MQIPGQDLQIDTDTSLASVCYWTMLYSFSSIDIIQVAVCSNLGSHLWLAVGMYLLCEQLDNYDTRLVQLQQVFNQYMSSEYEGN